MEIVSKTARDGRTPITISLESHQRPTTGTTYVLAVAVAGSEVARMENSRPRPMAEPIGELTHGLIIGPNNKSVGLTASEAQRIDTAVDAWKAEHYGPAPTDEQIRDAVDDLHCLACGKSMSDLDMAITSVEGYHPDCV